MTIEDVKQFIEKRYTDISKIIFVCENKKKDFIGNMETVEEEGEVIDLRVKIKRELLFEDDKDVNTITVYTDKEYNIARILRSED